MKAAKKIAGWTLGVALTLPVTGSFTVAHAAVAGVVLSLEPLTHGIFDGVDVSATIDGRPRRIVGMSRTRVELEVDGKIQRVEAQKLNGFVFQRGAKISAEFVELTEIKTDPAFRAGGAVDKAWAQARDQREMGERVLDIAEGRADMDSQDPRVRNALQQMRLSGTPKDVMAEVARRNIQAGEVSPEELEDEARRNRAFDALDVSFRVSSAQALENCHAVLICTIRSAVANVSAGQMVFFADLGNVQTKSKKVKVQFTGFPPGFQVLQTEFHVYSKGQEVASNVAPRLRQVAEKEARQFVTAQYVAAHAGETIPAKLVWAPPLTAPLERAAAKEKSLPVQFTIDAEGTVTAISGNSPTKVIQDYIAGLRFHPALENGKASPSTLRLTIGELVR